MNEERYEPMIYREDEIDEKLDTRIKNNLCASFPKDANYFKYVRGWHGSYPTISVIILDSSSNPVAHCGVIERTITINNKDYCIFGIQNLYVIDSHRGKSLAKKMLIALDEEVKRRGYDCGLLFASPDVAGLYTKLGWVKIENPTIILTDEEGNTALREFNHDSLYLKPLKTTFLPEGEIHFNGPDW